MKNLKVLSLVAMIFLAVGVCVGVFVNSRGILDIFSQKISTEDAKVKIESFLKDVNAGYQVGEITEFDSDLYRIELTSSQGNLYAYLSKSGNSLFQSMIDLNAKPSVAGQNTENTAPQETVKSEKPVVELFVMSHCPYGTQIEKGILPVLSTLGDKIDFQLKFVNYAMHDKKEIDEELSQYCINKLYPQNFTSYLNCFLEEGNGAACIQSQGFSQTQLDQCVTDTDTEFGIYESYADKSTWKGSYPSFAIYNEDNIKYSVAGSPTLIINGVTSDAARSSQALLTAICDAFESAPEECSAELSAATPAPGFGFGQTGSATDASCN